MTPHAAMLVVTACATAHFVATMVMAVFARHQVKYMAIAWVMGIFAFALAAFAPFSHMVLGNPGMIHPVMMLTLVVICYLQSIHPLSIPMPGYLQWERMWFYASPIIVLGVLYCIVLVIEGHPIIVHSPADVWKHLLSADILLRLVSVALSCTYIVGIFRLPQRLTHTEVPRYLYGYSTALGLSTVFYLLVAINYSAVLVLIHLCIFTLLNLYLCMRTLESMALQLPKPVIREVLEQPSEEQLQQAERDFNEANLQRFNRIEYWMQHNREEWTDSTFGRDRLCEAVGINRHLVLQCVRSQGYNNVHDYINSYRVSELKRRIAARQIATLTDCLDAGFGTIKTMRGCFLKDTGVTIDVFLEQAAEATECAK